MGIKVRDNMKNILRDILAFWNTFISFFPEKVLSLANAGRIFLLRICRRLNALGHYIMFKIYNIRFRYIVTAYIINFFIGRAFALQGDFPGSITHQTDLTIISLIILYMFQYMHTITSNLFHIAENGYPEVYSCLVKFRKAKLSSLNLLFPIFPTIFATKISIDMMFVPLSPIGYYIYLFYAATFYIAVVGYCLLIITAKTIYDLTKIDYAKLPFSYPTDLLKTPDWLKNLASLYHKFQFAFFTVGMLFTIEFIMLIPDDLEIITAEGQLNAELPTGFWYAWAIIFVFIIIALPIFWMLPKKFLTNLTLNFNQKALSELMPLNDSPDLTSIWSYYQLINHAVRYETKIFPKHNYYPLITTTVSFILNLSKMCELLKIPFGINL